MKYVFFATRELGAEVLKALLKADYSPALVVTMPDKPAGRKKELKASPVKLTAQEHNLPLAQPEDIRELLSDDRVTTADLFVVAAYGGMLPQELLDIPPDKVLNVHPSLLPLYRGPAPERATLLAGDKKTGVTVMLLDSKIDHGPILAQKEYAIPRDIRHEELHEELGILGGKLLVEVLPKWLSENITPKEQDHSKATFTKKATKEDGKIDWKAPADYIVRQIQAYDPWPGTYTFWNAKLLKILEANAADFAEYAPFEPGATFSLKGEPAVMTGKGALVLQKVQLEGKNPSSAKDFLLGHKDFLGTTLH